jgi:16S rRNA G1207 methylase RsmC
MFKDLTPAILADMSEFQTLVADKPGDPRCSTVVVALDKTAAQLSNWMIEADANLRKEKQTLYAGFLAAAEICRSVSNQHV